MSYIDMRCGHIGNFEGFRKKFFALAVRGENLCDLTQDELVSEGIRLGHAKFLGSRMQEDFPWKFKRC